MSRKRKVAILRCFRGGWSIADIAKYEQISGEEVERIIRELLVGSAILLDWPWKRKAA